jgi:hypothetical protein
MPASPCLLSNIFSSALPSSSTPPRDGGLNSRPRSSKQQWKFRHFNYKSIKHQKEVNSHSQHTLTAFGTNGMSNIFYSKLVTLLVGPHEIPMRAHKDLLCAKSEFFRACLETDFAEAGSRVVICQKTVSITLRVSCVGRTTESVTSKPPTTNSWLITTYHTLLETR